MESESGTFDIMVKGEKTGIAFDVNPVDIKTDEECKTMIEALRKKLVLTKADESLLECCLSVLSAKDGDDIHFGPGEIIGLSELAQRNPSVAHEIMACSTHLSESVDCEGELPPNFYLQAALAYGGLSNIMAAALNAGPISENTTYKDSDDEEITEEEITEEED